MNKSTRVIIVVMIMAGIILLWPKNSGSGLVEKQDSIEFFGMNVPTSDSVLNDINN